jgi:hypothetical protein
MSHPLVVDGKRKHGLGPNVCELVHNLRHIFGPAAAGALARSAVLRVFESEHRWQN